MLSLRLLLLAISLLLVSCRTHPPDASKPVTVTEDPFSFTLDNGLVTARIAKRSGNLVSLKYQGLELMASGSGSTGGYWSSVGRVQSGEDRTGRLRTDPATNGGALAEVACSFLNDPDNPTAPVDIEIRYALGRGEHWIYTYAIWKHQPGYPAFSVGEARYALKLNPDVFDYMTIDANRRRIMPTGEDWDKGAPTNLKEARLMTTGIHKGTVEHKYDYSAVFTDTPAYGWSSTRHNVGLWIINPSLEYIGGGPTKAELTGHLDVNPGGLPTLLNMWLGSHYGGTAFSVGQEEDWTKFIGPFLIYCNATAAEGSVDGTQRALWQEALRRARSEERRWPYAWLMDTNYPPASGRGSVTGQLVLTDPWDPAARMSNVWVGVTAPDWLPARTGFGRGRRFGTNGIPPSANPGGLDRTPVTGRDEGGFRPSPGAIGRNGMPVMQDWQRDAKHYQFWVRADEQGRFTIPNVRPGTYWLRAIADGVIGEFVRTNIVIEAGTRTAVGTLDWAPTRYGRTLWQIGVPDRTAREFRHGDDYWHWGLYFKYVNEFPDDVNFVVGQSDWRKDWNYVQPPRITRRQDLPVVGEEDEADTVEMASNVRAQGIESSIWRIHFNVPEAPGGEATLRLAFCGTHQGTDVEVVVNGESVGRTGTLPSTSAMQRDGIQAFWIEKPISFDAALLKAGENVIQLKSHANSWSQGVMYDCVRLEVRDQ